MSVWRRLSAACVFCFGLWLGLSAQEAAAAFRCEPTAPHEVVLLLEGKAVDLPEMRGKVGRWLFDRFPRKRLQLKHIRIGRHHVFLVRRFADAQQALVFIRVLQVERPDFLQMNLVWAAWAVSEQNLYRLLRADSFRGYPEFYQTCYP